MKKSLAFILALCLCVGLCACSNEDTAHTEYPKDWDRIAEATKTLNRYYACETEAEYRAVLHSSFPQDDLKTIMDYMNEDRQIRKKDIGDYEQYVRKIKFVETHNGYDIFLISDGIETADGFRTPDQPLPEVKLPNFPIVSVSGRASPMALVVENGQYVIPYDLETDWASYYATIVQCTCDLGTVVVPGDPCKTCNGEGQGEQSSDETHNVVTNNCATCDGIGYVGQGADSIVNINELQPCPDCSSTLNSMLGGVGGIQMVEQCADCEGTGLENYTYGDCPLCNGVGYTRSGN